MDVLPQLWDIASELAPHPDPAEVADVAAAEHAGVTCSERLRGSRGERLRIRMLTGTSVVGVLVGVHSDGILVEDPPATWAIPLRSITCVDLAMRAPAPARGRERGHLLAAMRDMLGREVAVATTDQVIDRLRLVAVGADHLLVARRGIDERAELVPWQAVSWVRSG